MITISQVRQIAKLPSSSVLPDGNVQQYIDAATLIMEEDLASAGFSDERYNLIHLYLAAHFATITEEYGGLVHQVVGESEERYQNSEGSRYGIAATRFGQQAIALDNTGILANLSSSPIRAQFRVM